MLEALDIHEDSKILMSPGTKEVNKDDDSLPKVFGDDRKYRSIVATINSMATDMPDLQFACKEACREMSADSAVLEENQAHRQVPLGPREGGLEVPLEDWSRELEGFH